MSTTTRDVAAPRLKPLSAARATTEAETFSVESVTFGAASAAARPTPAKSSSIPGGMAPTTSTSTSRPSTA